MGSSRTKEASFSIPSIVAVIAAILSFAVGAVWGFLLAIVAIVAAVIGMVIAISPTHRGGIVSALALIAGGFALVAALIKAAMWLF